MNNSKLVFLLRSLNASEFKRLYLYLQSPFFNRNQQVIALYNCLCGYYPAFHSARLDVKVVFDRLFPDQAFDINRIRKLMSAFTKLVEAYLVALELEQAPIEQKKMLASAFGRRKLMAHFEKEMRALIAEIGAASNPGREHYNDLQQLNQELFFHPGTDKQRNGKELLEQAMQHLDSYYVLTKLQLSAEMRTRENILAEKHSIRFLEAVMQETRHSLVPQNPQFQIYLHIIELHQDAPGAASLIPAITLFKKILPNINLGEKRQILLHLLNHCIRLVNHGDTQHRQELFELYQLGIKHDLLLENEQISEITFSNIVATGTSLKAFDWVRAFIDNYAILLHEKIREDIKALSLAYWHFNKQAYNEAESALLGHRFLDTLNLLKSRCLLIRTYFEHFLLDNSSYSFLIDQCDAFDRFIRRQKIISKEKSRAYLNFIKYTKQLAKKMQHKEDISKLGQIIAALEVVSYKEWLLEKMKGH